MEAALLFALLSLPLHLLVQREVSKLADPRYLRTRGVVVTHSRALESVEPPIGNYAGKEIWAAVRFMGMTYRFSRIVDRANRDRIGPGELFIEPGLVYVTD